MKPYKGTKYLTVDDRYADGWAYNPSTRRWIKVACQQKKDAIEALPALLVSQGVDTCTVLRFCRVVVCTSVCTLFLI